MSTALVIYSWPRLWSMGTGRGSPDFYHSLMSLTRAFERVTVVFPLEPDSAFEQQAPPGVRAVGFDFRRLPLVVAPRSRPLRAVAFALNWLLRMLNYRAFNNAARRAALAACRNVAPEMVSAHGFMGIPAASQIAKDYGVPLVVRLFGVSLGIKGFSPLVQIAQFEETLGFRAGARRWIITVDGSGGEQAAKRLGVPPEKVTMLRAAVERGSAGRAANSEREEYRNRLGLAKNAKLVLRVCRLWEQQHVERMIEALPRALEDGTPVAGMVIGDGPERGALELLARSLGKTVVFTGALHNAELAGHYRNADLYAATSDRTNLGQSVLEALCHGLPVVALDTGQTRELIADGVNGRLLAPGDNSGLTDALKQLLADEELRARFAAGALDTAKKEIPGLEQRLETEAAIYAGLTANQGQ